MTLKYSILFLPTLFFLFIAPKSLDIKTYSTNTTDSLVPFHLILYSGDEYVEQYEMNIYKKSNKYYADNISPSFYVGKKSDSVWTVELDSNKIVTCIKFINKAKLLPKECESVSTSIKDYTIAFAYDTIKIRGDCDWDGLDFFKFRKILFQDKFSDLELRRKTNIENLNAQLTGRWYFKPLTTSLKRDDYFTLTRIHNSPSDCYWEFRDTDSFKNSCNTMLDFTYSNLYKWKIDGGDILLIIEGGFITDKKGNISVANYGSTFILDTLNDKKLKLKFLWK